MPAVKPSSAAPRRSKRRVDAVPEQSSIPLNSRSLLFALLLILSGTAALIYQVLWIRQLSLVVGIEVYSITIAVSAFFAGLAAGGAAFGHLADRWRRPLLLYCLLETGVALTGVVATILLAHSAELFVVIQAHAGILAWALPFLLVGTPAFLMGGTLPVAVRSVTTSPRQVAQTGGWVYATNTAGAIIGALASCFIFLPWLGVRGTAFAAALFNLAAAGIALALSRLFATAIDEAKGQTEAPEPPSSGARTALALYAVAGGIALGYEVVWSQAMTQFLSTRVFAFSIVLATYLAGLVAGSALYTRFCHRIRDGWGVFGVLISAAGVTALLEIACLHLWQLRIQFAAGNLALAATGSELARMCAQFLVAAVGIVFVPTLLLGASFPAALRLTAGTNRTGREVGMILALNTAGGIAGTLLTGFLLVPALGVVRTLAMLAIAAATVGALAVLLLRTQAARPKG